MRARTCPGTEQITSPRQILAYDYVICTSPIVVICYLQLRNDQVGPEESMPCEITHLTMTCSPGVDSVRDSFWRGR